MGVLCVGARAVFILLFLKGVLLRPVVTRAGHIAAAHAANAAMRGKMAVVIARRAAAHCQQAASRKMPSTGLNCAPNRAPVSLTLPLTRAIVTHCPSCQLTC